MYISNIVNAEPNRRTTECYDKLVTGARDRRDSASSVGTGSVHAEAPSSTAGRPFVAPPSASIEMRSVLYRDSITYKSAVIYFGALVYVGALVLKRRVCVPAAVRCTADVWRPKNKNETKGVRACRCALRSGRVAAQK